RIRSSRRLVTGLTSGLTPASTGLIAGAKRSDNEGKYRSKNLVVRHLVGHLSIFAYPFRRQEGRDAKALDPDVLHAENGRSPPTPGTRPSRSRWSDASRLATTRWSCACAVRPALISRPFHQRRQRRDEFLGTLRALSSGPAAGSLTWSNRLR